MSLLPSSPPYLSPGLTTIGTIRLLASQEADQPTPSANTFISISEYNNYINLAYFELYGILVEAMGDYYVSSLPYTFSTDGINQFFPLPTDFFKLLGVDQNVTPGIPNSSITLKTFSYGERNKYNVPYFPILPGLTNLRYRLSGNNLWLIPNPPASNQQVTVRYIPRPSMLSDYGTITLSNVAATDTITIQFVTGTASTTLTFTGIASGATGTEFNIGVSDTITATNLAAVMNANFNNLNFVITSSGPTVTVQLLNPTTVTWSAATRAFQSDYIALSPQPEVTQSNPTQSWTNILDGVNGWEEYCIIATAIRILQKEESDTSLLERRLATMKARIEGEAMNRDFGQPAHVNDVPNYDFFGSGGWGGGGWGE